MNARIRPESNLFDYFRAAVEAADASEAARLSEGGRLYLAQLLTERAHVDHHAPTAPTLVELRARAEQARPAEQARTLRELGDRSLYDLGQFKPHLAHKAVSLSYYEQMGSAAYLRLDDVMKRFFADAFGPLFRELGHRFAACVAVLDAIRRSHDIDALDRLYREWLTTGSDDAARRLRVRGVIVAKATVVA